MFPADLILLSEHLRDSFKAKGLMIATAESCTGGLIAGCLTAVSGSSAVVDRGFVTYTNEAKTEMLDVPADLIATHGAVSEPVARAMALGVLAHSRADVAVSVTGIAGPTGGTPDKPVGLVYIGAARKGAEPVVERHVFAGDRAWVRQSAVRRALEMAVEAVR
ncbi:MAG TPA: CinA family protein [Azospirillaceae bacterium]|nr:CinA family protein [Azospirillaceae bacterium]